VAVKELPKSKLISEIEDEIKEFWKNEKLYHKIVEKNKGKKEFLFIDGPPYTTGAIHLGTAWNKVLKDFILRYKRMGGFEVTDTPGFDMHGLPIEVKVEQKLKIKDKKEIEKIGISKFTSLCKEFALSNLDTMKKQFKDLAVEMNWDKPYMTLTNDYIEGVWLGIKRIYENNLLYKGLRPLAFCPRCETALAKHEYEYKTVPDYSIFVKFKIENRENEFILVWTTTPWTLPGNLAVMVNPFFDYVRVKVDNEIWLLAKGMATAIIQGLLGKDFELLEEIKGDKLEKLSYIHCLIEQVPYQKKLKKLYQNAHKIILSDEFVTLEQGTGCVHTAPGHGPEDFIIGTKYGLPAFSPVDESGKMTPEAGKYSGLYVKDASEEVIKDLKDQNLLLHQGEIEHEYAHCWRCKAPLVYRTVDQWFINVSKVSETMREFNKNILWIPDWAGDPWFDRWLETLQDWNISRQRYWGTPLPIWVCDKCGDVEVIGSKKELKEKTGIELEDLHRPWVDELSWGCKCGGKKIRVEDVLDVWIDSGSVVWASLPAMFGNLDFENWKKADLVLEGKDQIRGWFNSMMSLGTTAFETYPYKRVYMHGFVNDSEGKPMSKSLGNVVLPEEVIKEYGADTFRLYSVGTSDPGLDMKFGWKEVKDVNRIVNIFYNTYVYGTTFMKLANFDPARISINKVNLNIEDKWIISKINSLIKNIVDLFDKYNLPEIPPILQDFIMLDLSRWYIKIIRDRIAQTEDESRESAFATLFYVLEKLLKITAPIMPIISDFIYQHLIKPIHKENPISIHLTEWPKIDKALINSKLEETMDQAKEIIEGALSLRQENNIKLRWPAKSLIIEADNKNKLSEDVL
jgi:isoleucyl-tRNA synthetase